MNIHEYQAKALLRTYSIPVPDGQVADSDFQAMEIAEQLGGRNWVIKAQVHAGGRGKAGGVKVAESLDQVRDYADRMIGSRLATGQSGAGGKAVLRVLVEQGVEIEQEYYLGLVIDRATQRITLIASAAGGMEIEQIAEEHPEQVVKEIVDPAIGLLDFQCRKVASRLGLCDKRMPTATKIMKRLYRCFRDNDAIMAEINPLAAVSDGRLLALDAKIGFDDNALFRRSEISGLRDFSQEDEKEVEASGHGLNYIALEGEVGCIVNGAGLAMATMDTITHYGGRPANFLDVGGGASPEKIANAFRIVLGDPSVKVILLNIFAGINRCDWVAEGIVQAMRDQSIEVPVVVRLAGTNVVQGREILQQSGLAFIHADKLDDAARKAVEAV